MRNYSDLALVSGTCKIYSEEIFQVLPSFIWPRNVTFIIVLLVEIEMREGHATVLILLLLLVIVLTLSLLTVINVKFPLQKYYITQ